MKNNFKYIGIVFILIILSFLLNYYGQSHWVTTPLRFIALDHLLVVPFIYYTLLAFGVGVKFTYKKRLFLTTVITICYITISNITSLDEILGKASAGLIGAIITYLVMLVSRKKKIS